MRTTGLSLLVIVCLAALQLLPAARAGSDDATVLHFMFEDDFTKWRAPSDPAYDAEIPLYDETMSEVVGVILWRADFEQPVDDCDYRVAESWKYMIPGGTLTVRHANGYSSVCDPEYNRYWSVSGQVTDATGDFANSAGVSEISMFAAFDPDWSFSCMCTVTLRENASR
jgi:hypothetical protein